jgi:predicted ATPase
VGHTHIADTYNQPRLACRSALSRASFTVVSKAAAPVENISGRLSCRLE